MMATKNRIRIAAVLGVVAAVLFAAFAMEWHFGFDCFYFRSMRHDSLYVELALAWLASTSFTAIAVSGRLQFWRKASPRA